jgi:hypothetical protein
LAFYPGRRPQWPEQNSQSKMLRDRIVARLTKLEQRGYVMLEEPGEHRAAQNDTDPDTDTDTEPEGNMMPENRQPTAAPNPA